jgi:hypothetical protein
MARKGMTQALVVAWALSFFLKKSQARAEPPAVLIAARAIALALSSGSKFRGSSSHRILISETLSVAGVRAGEVYPEA